jgi:hypothetical protein
MDSAFMVICPGGLRGLSSSAYASRLPSRNSLCCFVPRAQDRRRKDSGDQFRTRFLVTTGFAVLLWSALFSSAEASRRAPPPPAPPPPRGIFIQTNRDTTKVRVSNPDGSETVFEHIDGAAQPENSQPATRDSSVEHEFSIALAAHAAYDFMARHLGKVLLLIVTTGGVLLARIQRRRGRSRRRRR